MVQAGSPYALKCVLDRCSASVLLVMTSPAILAASAAIYLTMGRPVFFRQERLGRRMNPFRIWKLRTMTEARDAEGALLPDAARLTRAGRVIRRLSLDELPQLVNIVAGEMSFVGPRPLPSIYRERYNAAQKRRHDVMPGLTGWAQTHGRNDTTWEERFAADLWYVDHWSLFLDLQIVLLTVVQVLRGSGVEAGQQVTMPEFMGGSATGSATDTECGPTR